jgi:putative inorganic carbon (HCO3(-)) transporter
MFETLVWLAPAAVLVAGMWRPHLGLIVLAAVLPFFGSPPGGPYLGALDAAGIAAILTSWRAGRAGPSPLRWPILALLAVSAASLVPLAYAPPTARPQLWLPFIVSMPGVQSWTLQYTWRALLNLLFGIGLYVGVRRAFRGRSLRPLGLGLAAGLIPLVGLGLAEQLAWVDLSSYRAIGPSQPLATRLHSLFFNSGWLAEYLAVATPVAVGALALRARGRAAAGALVALTPLCLLFTQQRGGWVAMLAILASVLLLGLRSGLRTQPLRRLLLSSVATLLLGSMAFALHPSSLAPLARRLAQWDLAQRPHYWQAAIHLVAERPALGWGLGAFGPAYDQIHPRGSPESRENRATAHSLYLHVAAERGLLGIAALVLLAWAAALCLRRGLVDREIERRVLAVALAGSGVGIAVYGLVQYVPFLKNTEWLLWLLLGSVSLLSTSAAPRPARWSRLVVLTALLLVPIRTLLLEVLDGPGDRSFGFNEREGDATGSWEWTERFAARRLAWEGEALQLSMANGHPRPQLHPVEVRVRVEHLEIVRRLDREGWNDLLMDLGPPTRPWIVLAISARPVFRPFDDNRSYPELPRSSDIRPLGVVLRDPRWIQEPPTGAPKSPVQ